MARAVVEIKDGLVTDIINKIRLAVAQQQPWIINELEKRGIDPDVAIVSIVLTEISSPVNWDYAQSLCTRLFSAEEIGRCIERVLVNVRLIPIITNTVINLVNMIDRGIISRDALRVARWLK